MLLYIPVVLADVGGGVGDPLRAEFGMPLQGEDAIG